MKKTIAMSLAAVMSVAALAGCSGGSSAPAATKAAETSAEANGAAGVKDTPGNARVVKFGNSGAIGEPAPQTCQEFCDIVNAKIGDRYYFEFYPAEQLGNETTMLENIQVGLQEGMMCALDTLATYESDLNILSMAFAFDSYDNMIGYLKSDVAAPIWETLDGQGIHVINFEFQKNPRIFFANKELKSPADMVGMKYRIPNLPIFEKNARAMGATPVVVAWSEWWTGANAQRTPIVPRAFMNPPNLWLMWTMRTRLSRFASPPSSGTAYLPRIRRSLRTRRLRLLPITLREPWISGIRTRSG